MDKKVDIIISNYNYSKYVDSAIESCLNQSIPCNIIVVDDASTDNSWDVIQRYIQHGITAVRLRQNSGGNARGKNVGIMLSKCDYITCLDSDDMLLPDSIECRLKSINGKDFVHGWSIAVTSEDKYKDILRSKRMKIPFTRSAKSKKVDINSPRWSFAVEASTVLANRKLYHEFGLYDEVMRWSIDREMWWRWLDHGATMSVVDKYVSIYRHHGKQVTSDRKRKDPVKCSNMLLERQTTRKIINDKNTILMNLYNYKDFILDQK